MFIKLWSRFFKKSKPIDTDAVEYLTTNQLFHRLWTKAVGTQDYNKEEWLSFEKRLQAYEQLVERIWNNSMEKSDETVYEPIITTDHIINMELRLRP